MPSTPAVSVVVPTRNRRDAVIGCLAGLAAQTHPSFEVIVVDDGSGDGTAEAVAAFGLAHPGLVLTVLRNEPAAGANPSRNRGIAAAAGHVVAFIDDDAVAEPAWLERLVAGFGAESAHDGATDSVASVPPGAHRAGDADLPRATDDPRHGRSLSVAPVDGVAPGAGTGAVTGLTLSARPRNVWELTLKGTQRVHATRDGHATRLVGTNMAVRRSLLTRFPLDEDRAGVAADMAVSARSDEEGLFLLLRAAGFAPRVVNDAIVHHDHPHSASSFFRQAFRGGRSAARLVYKYRLSPRVDLVPFALAYLTLPLAFAPAWGWVVPVACFGLGLLAIAYNDLYRKRKTLLETVVTFPVLTAYYQVRLAGYVLEALRLWAGIERLARVRLPA